MYKSICYLLALIVLVAFGCGGAYAAQAQSQMPDSEKRSSIHAVDAYAYLSEDKTLSQIRSEAFALAKRQALEAAQTYIQSKTKVENFALSYDLVWSEAEGSVRVLEQKDHGVVENSRYHVWIKAEVFYGLAPKNSAAANSGSLSSPSLATGDGPLTVKVWTDKKKYLQGEDVVIFLQGNRDFSAVVVDVMASGDIIQLLPNRHRTDNFFKAGVKYRIPGPQDQFSLAVSPPFGTDKIVVYASEAYMDSLPTQAIGGGLGAFMGTQKDVAVKTRGIQIRAHEESQPAQQGVEFYEAQWAFVTAAQ